MDNNRKLKTLVFGRMGIKAPTKEDDRKENVPMILSNGVVSCGKTIPALSHSANRQKTLQYNSKVLMMHRALMVVDDDDEA